MIKDILGVLFLVVFLVFGIGMSVNAADNPSPFAQPSVSPEMQHEMDMIKNILDDVFTYTDSLILDHVLQEDAQKTYQPYINYIVDEIFIKKYKLNAEGVGAGIYGQQHDGYMHPTFIQVIIKGYFDIPNYIFKFELNVSELPE